MCSWVLFILKVAILPITAIAHFIARLYEYLNERGKVTVAPNEERPTRMSSRLRGRTAEEYGDLPGIRRRKKPVPIDEMDDNMSLADDSDIVEDNQTPQKSFFGNWFSISTWSLYDSPSKRGKVTVAPNEEHPTRMSMRLRGRAAEECGDVCVS